MPGPPMHYIRNYSEEGVRRGTAPRPPPPIPDTYSMFGITINNDDAIIQTLESQVRGGTLELLVNFFVNMYRQFIFKLFR